MKFQGIVLAGGKSSRFGEDKAQAKINGVTLLEKSILLLKQFNLSPVVVTNDSRDYRFLGCPLVRDILPDKGPLGGIYTAMMNFKDSSLVVLTCDMPGLNLTAIETLMTVHETQNSVTVYERVADLIQPFPGIYESSLAPQILDRLRRNILSAEDFIDSVPEKKVLEGACVSEIFVNINEKQDLVNFISKEEK